MKLRAEMAWMFGLPYQVVADDECGLFMGDLVNGKSDANGNNEKKLSKIKHPSNLYGAFSSAKYHPGGYTTFCH